MNKNCSIKEYGIPDGKIIGSFGLDKLDDLIIEISEHIDLILKSALSGDIVTLGFNPYHITVMAQLYENCLLLKFEEYNDDIAKHEDAGKSELYILDDRIVYIVTEVDPRINKEYIINTDKVERYKNKLNELVLIPEEVKSATNFGEKVKFFFTYFKRKKQKEQRDYYIVKIKEYINKLLNSKLDLDK